MRKEIERKEERTNDEKRRANQKTGQRDRERKRVLQNFINIITKIRK